MIRVDMYISGLTYRAVSSNLTCALAHLMLRMCAHHVIREEREVEAVNLKFYYRNMVFALKN